MNKLSAKIFFLLLCLTPLISKADENFDDRHLSLGLLTGYGYGYKSQDCLDCDSPRGSYQFIPVMLTGAYRFNYTHSTRLGVGLDYYTKHSPYDKNYYLAAEGYYIYHFKNERQLFSPYFLAGFRFPRFNIGMGLGNEFSVQERMSLILEVIASSYFSFDSRIESRVGVLFHF